MAKKVIKSKIKQALDQLSLDFAENTFLNIITSNYGLERPPIGYTDDEWRAIAKLIQVQDKTPTQKIIALLELILGPERPFATELKKSVIIGDTELVLWETAGLPQIGTLFLDKGTGNEESLKYRFVDYSTNTVYLSSPTTKAHSAGVKEPVERAILSKISAANDVAIPVIDNINSSTISILQNSNYEEVVSVGLVLPSSFTCKVFQSVVNPIPTYAVSSSYSTLSSAYQQGNFNLPVVNISPFPPKGYIQIIPAAGAGTFTVTGNSATNYAIVTGFEDSSLIGYKVKFTGNVTSALANKISTIVKNTSTLLTFDDHQAVGATTGDTFTIIPVVPYEKVDALSNSIVLRNPLSPNVSLPTGSKIELLRDVVTLKNSTVYVPSGGWRLFQADNKKIYIKLAPNLETLNTLTASYLSKYPAVAPSTTSSSFSGNTLTVASTASFPLTGMLRYQPAGLDLHLAYYTSSATTFTIPYPPAGASSIVAGQPVTLHTPVYTGTTIRDGNFLFNIGNGSKYPSWLGPYVVKQGYYPSVLEKATLAQNISGPTELEVSVIPSASAAVLEVKDSSYAPIGSSFLCRIGVETFSAVQNSLRSVAKATVSSSVLFGVTSISATGTTANASSGGSFPSGKNYRIVIGPNTANEEIAFVSGLSGGVFTLANPTKKPHSSGELICLAADCITVSQIDTSHIGRWSQAIPASQPHTNPFAMYGAQNIPETVEFLYNSVTVTNAGDIAGWAPGTIRFSRCGAGKRYILGTASAGATTLAVDSAANLPAPPFKLHVGNMSGRGGSYIVSGKTSSLTTAFDIKYAISNETCIFPGEAEEEAELSLVSGTSLSLDDYISFKSDHASGTAIYRLEARYTPASYVGTNFSLRLPYDSSAKLSFILDLVKAAGVQINFI